MKFKLLANLGLVGCNAEDEVTLDDLGFNEEDWEELTAAQRDMVLGDVAYEMANERLETWYEICDEERGNCY